MSAPGAPKSQGTAEPMSIALSHLLDVSAAADEVGVPDDCL